MALSLHDFTLLFLAKLADRSGKTRCDHAVPTKQASIPFNYKERIEAILCDDKWNAEFSDLIDYADYFDDHFRWELLFVNEVLKVVASLGKNISYNIIAEQFTVTLFVKEIKSILDCYDEKTVKKMNTFLSVFTDYIYSREYREIFVDYCAKAVKKMHDLGTYRADNLE